MSLSKREKILLVILGITIVSCSVYKFVYTPVMESVREQERMLEANKQVLEDLRNQFEKNESLLEDLNRIENEINSYERKILYSKDMPGTFVDLYYLIHENKLSGDSISFGDVIEGQDYNSFTISFSVDGNKNNIYNFIKSLQNYKKEISISNITFQPTGNDEMKLSVTLKTYILKDASEKGPEDYDFMNEKTGSFEQLLDMFKTDSLSGVKR